LIEFKHVNKTYSKKGQTIDALKDVSFQVNKGDIYGVIGYSGAGKSTLIRLVNQLETTTSGDVIVDGENINQYSKSELRRARKHIGMIFQHFNLLETKTVFNNVAIPLYLIGTPKEEIKERVHAMLEFVGIGDKAKQYPKELSGGQKQRVAIARALITRPKILLCDEATSALDPATTEQILSLLKKVNDEFDITILIITHEMTVIQQICDKVAVMENGELIEHGSVKQVFSQPRTDTAKRFVSTVIKTSPTMMMQQSIKQSTDRHLFKLFVDTHQLDVPFIEHLIQTLQLNVSIIHAFMAEIQEDTVCYLWLNVQGSDQQIQSVHDYFSSHNIIYEEVA